MRYKFFNLVILIATICLLDRPALAQQKHDMMVEPPSKDTTIMSTTIHQEIDFVVSPERVYNALLDGKQFSEFSGAPAEIDSVGGGAFSLFGGRIVGRNIELIPNHMIVQAWRVAIWPAGVYSIVKFELKSQGSGTHLVFDHSGFSAEFHDHLAAGWKSNYWDLLTKYLH